MQYWQVSVSAYDTVLMSPGAQLARWMVTCSEAEPREEDFLKACEFFKIKVLYPNTIVFQKYIINPLEPIEPPAFESGCCQFWELWRPGRTQRLS